MSDESEIIALLHRYAFLLDDGDIDGVAALFEDATWHSDRSDAVRRGASEVRPVYEQLVTAAGTSRTRHLLTNLSVTVAPDGSSASARSYWTVLQADGGRPIAVSLSGQYLDHFTMVEGRWRFADRLVTTDLGVSPPVRPPDLGYLTLRHAPVGVPTSGRPPDDCAHRPTTEESP